MSERISCPSLGLSKLALLALVVIASACGNEDDVVARDAEVVLDAGLTDSATEPDAGSSVADGGVSDAGSIVDAGQALRVLFIGNSYTHVNDLPGMLHRIAETSGVEPRIDVESITPGGASLWTHWQDPEVHARLNERTWSHVVLQGQSAEYDPDPTSQFQTMAYLLGDAVVEAGAVPTWYVTWSHPHAEQDKLTSSYAQASAHWPQSVLSCVGEAFRHGRDEHPEIALIALDGSHPSVAGTYLAASTFYLALTGKPVSPLSEVPSDLSAAQAVVLRQLASVGSRCADVRIRADLRVTSDAHLNQNTLTEYAFDFGSAGVPVPNRFIVHNEGELATGLAITQGPVAPFSWSSGAWPGLATAPAGGPPPCTTTLAAKASCALSLTYSGAAAATSTVVLSASDAYQPRLSLNLTGTVADGPVLVIRLPSEPLAVEAGIKAPIVVETAVGATAPVDVLLTNRGSASAAFYPHSREGPRLPHHGQLHPQSSHHDASWAVRRCDATRSPLPLARELSLERSLPLRPGFGE